MRRTGQGRVEQHASAILSILAGADAVEFRYVQELTGLSRGNLSSHMSKLEAAGLVMVEKAFRGKMPVTTLRFSRKARNEYRGCLSEIVAGIPVGRVKR